MTTIYHIISRSAWDAAQRAGVYHSVSLDSEGFIHFSDAKQVLRVANAFYSGQTDLLVLVVDTDKVAAQVRYEAPAEAPESSERFPHIYGELNLDAIVRVVEFPPDADGKWLALPPSAID